MKGKFSRGNYSGVNVWGGCGNSGGSFTGCQKSGVIVLGGISIGVIVLEAVIQGVIVIEPAHALIMFYNAQK